MEIEYTQQAQDDLKFWQKSGNKSVQNRIVKLLDAILENPHEGIGKPETLKYELTGKWSRRITAEHRIIYVVTDSTIFIQSLKGHYLF
ncbi:Txe/YoeB family addiction module toxin [Pedobacter sp. CFBP9032]|uniref:Txe/YoeB family addiction module toxin n=1 Tax=Pedobacter sp. CFBP9032 TaxID=3096539 RepID=UPI002A6A75AF|nr:Txe/YoeB family addiction module toxin [Pedobacter sp. CFBP9032]MDY0907044.1 Txe/YoeB family addiction module toxin [Pedobacter sp. CFBP9032]